MNNITVVGAGAVGSNIIMMLSQLRIDINITVYDFDTVEEKNSWNQIYSKGQAGELKTRALKKVISDKLLVAPTIYPMNSKIETIEDMMIFEGSDIVFLCVDSMESRRLIVSGMQNVFSVKWVIETRMNRNDGEIFTFRNQQWHKECWMKHSLHNDVEKEKGVCGGDHYSANTVAMISSLAVNNYSTIRDCNTGYLCNHISFTSNPFTIIGRNFDDNKIFSVGGKND